MKIYSKKTVYEKSFERIEWVFREFGGRVICSSSGGKDSTVVFEIAIEVINKLKANGVLPKDYRLKVMWLDQEAEWTKTVEYMERIAERSDVEMFWSQVPFLLGHNASLDEVNKLEVYDPNFNGEYCQPLNKYAYDKLYIDDYGNPISIEELNKHRVLINNRWTYDKDFKYKEYRYTSFYLMFDDIYSWISNGKSYAVLQGLKASESPRRTLQLTYQLGYKGITWSSSAGIKKESVKFSPIYDWSRTDNFTYFANSGCDYNELYDEFLRFGISPSNMRVSSLIHETSVAHNATIVQELDRDLYNRLAERLPGISTYSQLQENTQKVILPPNFTNYEEYARYLIENVTVEKNKECFLSMFKSEAYKRWEHKYKTELDKLIISSILTKDVDKTKWKNGIGAIEQKEKRNAKKND